jgi:hypothetical protein
MTARSREEAAAIQTHDASDISTSDQTEESEGRELAVTRAAAAMVNPTAQ